MSVLPTTKELDIVTDFTQHIDEVNEYIQGMQESLKGKILLVL